MAVVRRILSMGHASPLLAGGAAVVFIAALFFVSQGRIEHWLVARMGAMLLILVQDGGVAAAYLAAALGYGYPVRRGVGESDAGSVGRAGASVGEVAGADRARMGWSGQCAVGLAIVCLVDWLLGCFGGLTQATAWAVCVAGWGLLSWQVWGLGESWREGAWPSVSWHAVLAAPAAGLVLGAATIAPGVLWLTEAGGYDVLEYHLQLPREWAAMGHISGLEHNAYSYMPNLFEAAYMHLGVWRGSVVDAAYAAQLLHAMTAILTALVLARTVTRCTGNGGALAGALYLAVPWTIVTGSMAYTEQAMMAMGAAALSLTLPRPEEPRDEPRGARYAAVAGFLCGAAVMCKLSALGLVLAPIGATLLIGRGRGRPSGGAIAAFLAAAAAVISLWIIRNVVWLEEPLFPVVGQGHWTAAQAARFHAAHGPESVLAGLWALVRELVLHEQFAFVVVPAALAAAVAGWRSSRFGATTRALVAMAGVQVAFWIVFTHQQGRFLVPLLLPMCVLVGIAVCVSTRGRAVALGVAALTMWCTAMSFIVYLNDPGVTGVRGEAAYFIDGVSVLRDLNPAAPVDTPYTVINADPSVTRIYAEGFATPLYLQRPLTYHTVWDASKLGVAMAEGGVSGAREFLKHHGYSHVLIDWGMLERWMSPGNYGYDPRITLPALEAMAQAVLEPVHTWGPLVLYRVR